VQQSEESNNEINGLSRPGALLMIVSIVAGLVASIGPIVLAITSPTH